jgi:hypothetical protein
MTAEPQRLVPKVHPLTRAAEPEDPLELVAAPAAGDPAVMLDGLIQEFAAMGWDAGRLLGLFRSPAYPLLNLLWEHYGEQRVRRRVEALVGSWGAVRVREVVAGDPGPGDEDGPELLSLSTDKITRRG